MYKYVKYLKTNSCLLIASVVVFLLIFSARIVNYDIGIDSCLSMSGMLGLNHLEIGRWTRVLLTKVLMQDKFSYYFANFVAAILIILSNFSWLYFVEKNMFNNSVELCECSLKAKLVFLIIYLSSMVWIEIYYFTTLCVEFTLIVFVCPFSLDYFCNNFKSNKCVMLSGLLFFLYFSIYQAIAPMYIAGVIIYLYLSKFNDRKEYGEFLIRLLVVMIGSFSLYFLADKMVIFCLDVKKSNYFSSMLKIDYLLNPIKLVKRLMSIIAYIVLFFFGGIPYISDLLYKILISTFGISSDKILQWKEYYFLDRFNTNIISVILILVYCKMKKIKFDKIILMLLLILCSFSLHFLGNPPIRAMYHLPLIWSFIGFLTISYAFHINKKFGYAFLMLILLCGLHKIEFGAMLNTSDHLRFENDLRISENICRDLDKIRDKEESEYKIYIIGDIDVPYEYGFSKGEIIGKSIFSHHGYPDWQQATNYGQPFLKCLGHNYKQLTDENKCIDILRQANAMKIYPLDGYIKLIDDIFVIKLSEIDDNINEIEMEIKKKIND